MYLHVCKKIILCANCDYIGVNIIHICVCVCIYNAYFLFMYLKQIKCFKICHEPEYVHDIVVINPQTARSSWGPLRLFSSQMEINHLRVTIFFKWWTSILHIFLQEKTPLWAVKPKVWQFERPVSQMNFSWTHLTCVSLNTDKITFITC